MFPIMSECGEKPLSKIFSRSPRIREDSLAKMPAEERVYRTLWMVEQASIQCLSNESVVIKKEKDDIIPF